jgi:hypothetical protein
VEESSRVDNQAQVSTPTDGKRLDTLFVVAGDQMAQTSDNGASPVLSTLYQLAPDARIKGAVLDVGRALTVAQAYAAWAADETAKADPAKANAVATAVRQEILSFLAPYSNTRYLVFVGGDNLIPFYRVRDASDTHWQEKTYGRSLPQNTVGQVLKQDYYLTDDFYTDDAPEVPQSQQWPDSQRVLYLPDRISARLVETPEEILAALAAFRDSNGELVLGPALLGGDKKLTYDTITTSCQALDPEAGIAMCTDDEPDFANSFATPNWTTAWTAFHANHMINGEVLASQLRRDDQTYAGRLWVSIGCHSGLNVPDVAGEPANATDLMQVFVGKGGVAIAPTAYGYASRRDNPSYSERYLLTLAQEVQACTGQTIGAAYLTAKHRLFAETEHWFDGLEEKALLPLTLYGLPHWRIQNGSATVCAEETQAVVAATVAATQAVTATVIPLDIPLSEPQVVDTIGRYYEYQGQSLIQHERPIQPAHHLSITPALNDGAWPHGIVLLDAAYTDRPGFDPVIEQAWIISLLQQGNTQPEVEPPVTATGWDHDFPHSLGYYPKLPGAKDSQAVASINLVLGACQRMVTGNADQPEIRCEPERLFQHLNLAVFYSTSEDEPPPGLATTEAFMGSSTTLFTVAATETLTAAFALCDDGQGHYRSGRLTHQGERWVGSCPLAAQRYAVQAVDLAGNVTSSDWRVPGLAHQLFLPTLFHDYATPRPDLVPTAVYLNDEGNLAVDFQNVGPGWVVDDFWVDLCFMNSALPGIEPPKQEDDVCKGRAHDYLVWLVAATQTPIPPQAKVTLTVGQADPTESVFIRTIPARTPLYVHVDATNANTFYGGVWEVGESITQTTAPEHYNNILGPVTLAQTLTPPTPSQAAALLRNTQVDTVPLRVDPPALTLTSAGDADPVLDPPQEVEAPADDSHTLWLPFVSN